MPVLSFTVTLRYYNCYADGSTGPGNYGYRVVCSISFYYTFVIWYHFLLSTGNMECKMYSYLLILMGVREYTSGLLHGCTFVTIVIWTGRLWKLMYPKDAQCELHSWPDKCPGCNSSFLKIAEPSSKDRQYGCMLHIWKFLRIWLSVDICYMWVCFAALRAAVLLGLNQLVLFFDALNDFMMKLDIWYWCWGFFLINYLRIIFKYYHINLLYTLIRDSK
jgi:hypothetical protein